MKILTNKTALITGGSKGLGRAMAKRLAEAGANVLLVSRNRQALESVQAELRPFGTRVEIYSADVSEEQQIAALEKEIRSSVGPIDILVNNAGINIRKPVTEFTLEEWNRVLNTNLTGVFLMCRAFVPHMKGKGYGRIINMTSIMSHVALPHRSVYAASKAGLLGFTRALALELAPDNIGVVGISPGPFATEMNQPILQDPVKNQEFISRIPLGRWGRVEDIGELVTFLCSPAANFITGTDILIDGGWTAQ